MIKGNFINLRETAKAAEDELYQHLNTNQSIYNNNNSQFDKRKNTGQKKLLSKKTKKVTKLVAVVTLNFALCWLPAHLFILLITLIDSGKITKTTYTALSIFKLFAHTLSYLTPVINPILYGYFNENFRNSLSILCGCKNTTNLATTRNIKSS